MEYNIPNNYKSGIYSISNSLDGRIYIGSTVNFKKRYSDHKSRLKHNNHLNKYLQAFSNKYGIETLSFNLLCLCKNTCLIYNEKRLIELYDTNNPKKGFNIKILVNRPYFDDEILYDIQNIKSPLEILIEKYGIDILKFDINDRYKPPTPKKRKIKIRYNPKNKKFAKMSNKDKVNLIQNIKNGNF